MELKEFLLEEGQIGIRKLSYYIYWIELFKKETQENHLSENKESDFFKKLQENRPSWQVQQAGTAINLYKRFLKWI